VVTEIIFRKGKIRNLLYLRNIMAVLLALFVASPLCCCAAFSKQAGPAPSCCGSSAPNGSDNGEHPAACHCASKQAMDTAKAIITPVGLATLAAPPSTDTMLPVSLHAVETETARAITQDIYDPPGALLLRYSRWLI
jgi:hypothetical protein